MISRKDQSLKFLLAVSFFVIFSSVFLIILLWQQTNTVQEANNIIEGEILVTGGDRLPYWFYNRDTDYVLVYLHGGPGSNSSAIRNAYGDKLADSLGSIIFYDQRSTSAAEYYTFEQAIDDLNTVVRNIVPNKQIILWGHSFGGTVAVMNAYINTEVAFDAYILDAPWLNEALCVEGRHDIDENQLRQNLNEREIMLSYKSDSNGYEVQQYWSENEHLSDIDLLPYLQYIDEPVLVLAGTWDNNVTINQIEAMEPYMKNTKFQFINESGHNALFSNEEIFISSIRSFLQDL